MSGFEMFFFLLGVTSAAAASGLLLYLALYDFFRRMIDEQEKRQGKR